MNESEVNLAAILNVFTSWEYADHFEGGTLEEVLLRARDQIAETGDADAIQAYEILSDAVERYPGFGDTKILGQSWNQGDMFNSETVACAFELPSGEIYVSYCGTGDGGWIDNAHGVTEASTQQQEEAARYFDYLVEKYGWTEEDQIIITGHSKGGNKSQYVTLMAENNDLIDTCYSMDGQGFSDEAIEMFREKYGEEGYQEILDKMYAINGYNDYVSPLINPIIVKDHTIYLETTENPDGGMQGDYEGFHMVNMYFRYEDGEFISVLTPETERGPLGDLAERLSEYLMSLPDDQKDAAAMLIMQILENLEGRTVGVDGDHVSVDDILSFGADTIVPVVFNIIGSEEGRQVLADLLRRFSEETNIHPAIIGVTVIVLAPLALNLLVSVSLLYKLVKFIRDMIEKLGEAFAKAVEAFSAFIDYIQDIGNDFIEWIKSWGKTADYSWFRTDTRMMRRISSELRSQQTELDREAQRIRAVRKSVDFGLLTKQALYFKMTSLARNLEYRADELGRLAQALEKCADQYEKNERKIVDHYQTA